MPAWEKVPGAVKLLFSFKADRKEVIHGLKGAFYRILLHSF